MTLPTTLNVSGAGSHFVNGTYVWSGSNWKQSNGVHNLKYWNLSGFRVGWYLAAGDYGMYFAEGASSTFPTRGWEVYTGPCHKAAYAPAPSVATDSQADSRVAMEHAVVQLPKILKDKFTWDFVKEIVVDKVKDKFFDILLAPFGLHGLAKKVVVEVINGVCHIYYRKVVEKKPISRSFLVDTVKDALQTAVTRWGLDVVVGDLFGKTVKDDFDNCMDTIQAASDVAKDELEFSEKCVLWGGHYYRVLDETCPDEDSLGTQSKSLQLPAGWVLAPESYPGIVAAVIAGHKWGTHVVVFANGNGYQTARTEGHSRKAGSFWRGNLLHKSGSSFKPTSSHMRILIRQRA